MKVATSTLTITEIEAELPTVPHEECAELVDTVYAIKGLKLSRGFSAEVKKRIGGRNGCIHLMTLLLAMAPAALQGYWVNNDRDPKRRRLSGDHMEQYLVDSCWVWRREGPLVKEIAHAANAILTPQNDKGKKVARN